MSQLPEPVPQSTAEAVSLVAAAVGAGDYQGASHLAVEAINLGFIHPALYNAQALWLERQGRDEDALALFYQARAFVPKDVRLLNAIGLCLMRLSRLDEALATFQEAVRNAPAHGPSHHRLGVALGHAGRWDEAQRAHARAAQLDPRLAEAIASAAAIAARKGDETAARAQAERALRIEPGNATAHVALATIELARGEFSAAEARLNPLLQNPQLMGHGRAVALGLWGDALDGLDRPAEAFAAYEQSNCEMRKIHARFAEKRKASELVEQLSNHLSAADRSDWRQAAEEPETSGTAKVHSFLLGFPRSGTTLLEQALESREDTVTLEENDLLADMAERYLSTAEGFDSLRTLQGLALASHRDAYWQRLRDLKIDVEGKVFVDKHPLNTIKLPLIAKLFPDAKIIFAVRDPRDVVLSCFRRHLDVDLAKYELLTLQGAVRLYDRAMRLGELCRETFSLACFEYRYENLVADFDGSTRAVCEFLGVPWRESMRDFAVTARALDSRQASAGQVRRGLRDDSVGQWRRYEAQLSPILPVLQPWVERFGYE